DYLKYDNCNAFHVPGGTVDGKTVRYPTMSKALKKTGRNIFYAMCNWGFEDTWLWASPIANSWRTTTDLFNGWDQVIRVLDLQVNITSFGGPGGWNDMDMLQVGNGGLNFEEAKSQFSLWAALKSPLIIGCDLNTVAKDQLQIMMETDIIAINQDRLGAPARRAVAFRDGQRDHDVWTVAVENGNVAV
ncbi:glycoside hydrolase superfamily, partial [Blyttiomyces helicus]